MTERLGSATGVAPPSFSISNILDGLLMRRAASSNAYVVPTVNFADNVDNEEDYSMLPPPPSYEEAIACEDPLNPHRCPDVAAARHEREVRP